MALGEYEDAIDTTPTPPRAQYGATHSQLEKRNSLRYGVFASLGKPQQRLMHHSSEQESGSNPLVGSFKSAFISRLLGIRKALDFGAEGFLTPLRERPYP